MLEIAYKRDMPMDMPLWATHAVSVLKGLALSGRREHTQTTTQK